jgi:hypothetical protein
VAARVPRQPDLCEHTPNEGIVLGAVAGYVAHALGMAVGVVAALVAALLRIVSSMGITVFCKKFAAGML